MLAKQMDPAVVAEIEALDKKGRYESPRYMELLGLVRFLKAVDEGKTTIAF